MQEYFESPYLSNLRSDLNLHFTNQLRIEWRSFSVKNIFFSIYFLVKKTHFCQKITKFFNFKKLYILSLGYQPLQAKIFFLDEMFLETIVEENVYFLGPPSWLCVTANFKGG